MSTSDLTGRTVLITGAARRIGAAAARGMHAAGANLIVHFHRSAAPAEQLVGELNKARPRSAIAMGGDLLDEHTPANLARQAVNTFGRLDVLINNASTFYPTPVGSITGRQWDDLIGTNLKAPLFLAQAAAPELRKHRGAIVNMIDIHARRPLPRHPVYSTAKAGLAMLTRSLARELAPDVRVNGIAPGPILWPEGEEMSPALKDEIISKTLLKRTGSPEDIVRALLFLVVDAPYVTGQILAVDGGRSVGW
jgi:pteridine reductase